MSADRTPRASVHSSATMMIATVLIRAMISCCRKDRRPRCFRAVGDADL
jgi:hypothetical protein